jgi:NAD(P)-dependent dehydrogenase (short-subunit alcohol dehydrogenase family)
MAQPGKETHSLRGGQARLREKVAIVVGAGRGIGEAVALRFAAEGARLTLAARTAPELEAVARRVRAQGGTAHFVVTDVTAPRQVASLVQESVETFGRIDILVNAAGAYGPIGQAWQVDSQEWFNTFSANLFGPFLLCQTVLPHMIRAGRGKIINFSGGGATSPLPRFTAYGVSKAALVRLTETLAEEVKEFNIQVNAIAPGAVDTKLQDAVLAAGEKAGDLLQRIRRLRQTGEGGTPRELPADLAVFLASDDSRNLTGRLISAPNDGWESWTDERIAQIMSQPWFTLRRIDPFTLLPLLEEMRKEQKAAQQASQGGV